MRYILTVDLIGSTVETSVEADDATRATAYAAQLYPEARSVTVSGVAATVSA